MFQEQCTYGSYRVQARLKGGDACVVYRALKVGDFGFTRPVTLTVLHPHLCGVSDAARAFREVCQLFGRAASTRIAAVEDAGEGSGGLYHVTPPPRGRRLDALLEWSMGRETGVPPGAALRLAIELSWAMDDLFEAGAAAGVSLEGAKLCVESIRLERGGTVRVHPPAVHLTKRPSVYVAPEVLAGDAMTSRAGVYAIGRLLEDLLARSGRSISSLDRGRRAKSTLRDLVEKAVAASPAERWGHLGLLAGELARHFPESIFRGALELDALLDALPPDSVDPMADLPADLEVTTQVAAVGMQRDAGKTSWQFSAVPLEALRFAEVGSNKRFVCPADDEARPVAPRLELQGAAPSEPLLLTDGERWVVGRGRDVNLVVEDPDASREHFEITRSPDGSYAVFDLGSKNGLVVNGKKVDSHRLSPGDEIVAGQSCLRYLE